MNSKASVPSCQPVLLPTAEAVNTVAEHNIYHFSRLTVEVRKSGITISDHSDFDVPKHKIEVCCKCEFREICYDHRLPVQSGLTWQYNSECAYDPIQGKWQE